MLRDRNLPFLSAAIAYYAFVSLIPLLLLAVVIASVVLGDTLTERLVDLVSTELSSSGQDMLRQLLNATTGRGVASVIGSVVLLWSALRLIRGLDQAFDEIYADGVSTSLPEQLVHGLTVFVAIALSGVIIAGTWWSLSALRLPYSPVLVPLTLVICLSIVFLPVYFILPPVPVSVSEVLPGVIIAALGIVCLQVGFQLYAANANQFGLYGAIGSVLIFVTWLYFASFIILFGVVVNASHQSENQLRMADR